MCHMTDMIICIDLLQFRNKLQEDKNDTGKRNSGIFLTETMEQDKHETNIGHSDSSHVTQRTYKARSQSGQDNHRNCSDNSETTFDYRTEQCDNKDIRQPVTRNIGMNQSCSNPGPAEILSHRTGRLQTWCNRDNEAADDEDCGNDFVFEEVSDFHDL